MDLSSVKIELSDFSLQLGDALLFECEGLSQLFIVLYYGFIVLDLTFLELNLGVEHDCFVLQPTCLLFEFLGLRIGLFLRLFRGFCHHVGILDEHFLLLDLLL